MATTSTPMTTMGLRHDGALASGSAMWTDRNAPASGFRSKAVSRSIGYRIREGERAPGGGGLRHVPESGACSRERRGADAGSLAFSAKLVVEADDIIERPGLARTELRGALSHLCQRFAHFAREGVHLAMELLLEGRQPRLGALEPAQRLIDCGQARFGDPCGLGIELPHGFFVRLLERAPLVLQAALELVDARGRLVQQPALDVVPLAETTVELDDGRRVLFVVFRPPIEDAGAVARHVGETRLEPLHRLLGETELLESDVDLFDLQLQIGFTLLDRQFTIRRARLFHCRR